MTDVFGPQSSSDATKFVKSFQSDGTAVFEQPEFHELDFSAVFGRKVTSTTSNSIAYGIKTFTLDVDEGAIQVGYPVQCRSLDDQDCFMQGVVTRKDTTSFPAEIDVAITIISQLINTSYNWELSVIPLAGFSINPSATVGISTTSIDASGAGPFTFTTQNGKLFMQNSAIGGTVVCTALADPKTYLFARIKAISGTGLVLTKIYSNATASVSAWSIQMFDGPDNGLLLTDIIGLAVTDDGATTLTITSGSCRDSTGTVDLILESDLDKDISIDFTEGDGGGSQVISGNLTGTISTSGTSVTGTGTAFLTDIPYLPEPLTGGSRTVINVNGERRRTATVTDDTTATLSSAASSNTNVTFTRGGYLVSASGGFYFIIIGRKDSTGACDVFTAQQSSAGIPDLPSGYTFYRKLAYVTLDPFGAIATITTLLASPSSAEPYLVAASAAFPNGRVFAESTSIVISAPGFGNDTYSPKRAALTGDVTASQDSNTTTIAANAVTNTKLNDMAAYTIKGRNAGTSGDPSDIDISALTEKTSLADDDLFLIQDSAASNAFKKAKKSNVGSVTTFPQDFGLITEAATLIFDSGTVP